MALERDSVFVTSAHGCHLSHLHTHEHPGHRDLREPRLLGRPPSAFLSPWAPLLQTLGVCVALGTCTYIPRCLSWLEKVAYWWGQDK